MPVGSPLRASDTKLCYLLPSWDMFSSMGKSEVENIMEAEIGGLVMVIGVFVAMRNLLGVSDFVAAVCKWGGSTCAVQSFISQGENPRSGLDWLCLAMVLLKTLF